MLKLNELFERFSDDPLFPEELSVYSISTEGDSLLHRVATLNDFEAASLLIENGAQVNLQGDMGCTPLHNAVEHADMLIAQKLLDAGADPNVINEFGETCVSWAISCGNQAAARLLAEHLRSQK